MTDTHSARQKKKHRKDSLLALHGALNAFSGTIGKTVESAATMVEQATGQQILSVEFSGSKLKVRALITDTKGDPDQEHEFTYQRTDRGFVFDSSRPLD